MEDTLEKAIRGYLFSPHYSLFYMIIMPDKHLGQKDKTEKILKEFLFYPFAVEDYTICRIDKLFPVY